MRELLTQQGELGSGVGAIGRDVNPEHQDGDDDGENRVAERSRSFG